MIDWYGIAVNALWIFALALALAVLSFAYWEKQVGGERLRKVLSRPRWSIPLDIAGIFFCIGLAAASVAIWEKILWLVIATIYGFQTWNAIGTYKGGAGKH